MKNLAKKLFSGVALALAFSNVAQAAIIEYNYSNSDSNNSITANFFIDDSKPTNNLVSGTFTSNGTSYTASSTSSRGFINASSLNTQFDTYTGYIYSLRTEDGSTNFDINNYVVTSKMGTTSVVSANFSNYQIEEYYSINGAGTLSIATPSTTAAVPEPEAYAMMLVGLGLLGFTARRKQKTA